MQHKTIRRIIAAALVVLGAILMVLAPEHITGYAILLLGIVIEIVGVAVGLRR
jgi:hypothetical protein